MPLVNAVPQTLVEVLAFTLGGEPWAVETRYLLEIVRLTDLATLPGAPPLLLGLLPVRGDILSVFDLRRLFDMAPVERVDGGPARVVVLGAEVAELGLAVDSVEEVRSIDTAGLSEPPETLAVAGKRLIRGVSRGTCVILDAAALLEDARFTVTQSEAA